MKRSALLSDCGLYRYSLDRVWGGQPEHRVVWLMLNPSTADAEVDDPTIRKCVGFSQRWGYDALRVVNLFAYRATNPADLIGSLEAGIDLYTKESDAVLTSLTEAEDVVVGWGANASRWGERVRAVTGLIRTASTTCLGLTSGGHPRHPLMLPYGTPRVRWGG